MIPLYYTDELGHGWVRNVWRYIFEQTDSNGRPLIGGRPYTADPIVGRLPSFYTPRHVVVVSPDNRYQRRVTIFSEDAPLWTGEATTIILDDGRGGVDTWLVHHRTGERGRGWHTPKVKKE